VDLRIHPPAQMGSETMTTCPHCKEEFETTPDPNEEFCSDCIRNVDGSRLSFYSKTIVYGKACPDCGNDMILKENSDGKEYQVCVHCEQIY